MKEREARELAESLNYRLLQDRTQGEDAWLVYDLYSDRRYRGGAHTLADVVAWLERERDR